MSEVAIRVENLSKRYQIGAKKSGSFRETLTNAFRRKSEAEAEATEFWALKDVSFEIKRGEAVGIIGKNGAGKSTLLKVLSRITEPTHGRIEINGRVASLLEVGTGFHPELTGRENIYMNGTILGMTRREIKAKLDEIIDFSGVEKFIDTPVKRYSSGMYVRLAFAVAAHLEPEILIIDEVLAVGDAEFQKKCLGKMGEVAKLGRTVLFVSHNMAAVEVLCSQALILSRGTIKNIGATAQMVTMYLSSMVESASRMIDGYIDLSDIHREMGKEVIIQSIQMYCDGYPSNYLYMGCNFKLSINFKHSQLIKYPVLGIIIKDITETVILGINNKHYQKEALSKNVKEGYITLEIDNLPLMSGSYVIDIFFGDGSIDLDVIQRAFSLDIASRDFSGTGYLPNTNFNKFFIKKVDWKFNQLNERA